jgi:hypothetical protein
VRQVQDGNNNEMPAVPITVRQLEAIVRISESLARMQLVVQATEAHVRFAIDLFKTSTMDAVRSGVIDITVPPFPSPSLSFLAMHPEVSTMSSEGSSPLPNWKQLWPPLLLEQ